MYTHVCTHTHAPPLHPHPHTHGAIHKSPATPTSLLTQPLPRATHLRISCAAKCPRSCSCRACVAPCCSTPASWAASSHPPCTQHGKCRRKVVFKKWRYPESSMQDSISATMLGCNKLLGSLTETEGKQGTVHQIDGASRNQLHARAAFLGMQHDCMPQNKTLYTQATRWKGRRYRHLRPWTCSGPSASASSPVS
eukprot:1158319-Pelagomonas_calceolata.AAC.2